MKSINYFILTFIIYGIVFTRDYESNFEFDSKTSSISAIDLLSRDSLDTHQIIYEYQPQIEYALVWRVRAVKTYKNLSEKSVLKAADINYLNFAAHKYKELREDLFNGIARYAPLTNKNVKMFIDDSKPTFFYHKRRFSNLFGTQPAEYIRINPNDEAGKAVIKKLRLGLVFALLLYDNYLVAVAPFEEHNKLRQVINEKGIDPDIQGYLREVSESYTDKNKLGRMIRAIKWNLQFNFWEADHPESDFVINDNDNQYLNKLIVGSISYNDIKKSGYNNNEPTLALNRINIFKNKMEDRIKHISGNATQQISKLFGNTAGIMVVRRGVMEKLQKNEKLQIIKQLQPLDILLEKAPFRLTDHLIPGYWSHVALWTGTETQLKELGVWEELPGLYKKAVNLFNYKGPEFRQAIRSGQMIIEALRPGVQINTFEHFLNIDDLGVIRQSNLTSEKKKNYLLNAFRQIGKNYDFNFDVESTNEIVCSELIFAAFDDYQWNTKKTMGRYTISPDNVAQKIRSKFFNPVILYINGNEIKEGLIDKFPIE